MYFVNHTEFNTKPLYLRIVPLGMNFSELLNIQKRDRPRDGPSFMNSCPSPFPHFPHLTWKKASKVQIPFCTF